MNRAVIVAAVALVLGGCSDEGTEPVGRQSQIPVEDAHEFGLPEQFPLPEGATEANLVTSGTEVVNVRFLVDRTPAQVEAFYGTELRKGGWRVENVDRSELIIVVTFAGNGHAGNVTIVTQGSPTQVIVTIAKES